MFRTKSEDMYVFSATELDSLNINILGPAVLTTKGISAIKAPAQPSTVGKLAKTDVIRPQPLATPETPEAPTATYGPRVALYGGLDFYGNDISSKRTGDVVECASACILDTQCRAFTFNANPSITRGPNCFLKTDIERLEAYVDALSGVFLSSGNEPAATYSVGAIDPTQDVLAKKGLTGTDFSTSPERGIASPGECRMACVDNNACRAFTYDSRLKQCYLKHTSGTPFSGVQLTSGIKRGASFAPLEVIELEE